MKGYSPTQVVWLSVINLILTCVIIVMALNFRNTVNEATELLRDVTPQGNATSGLGIPKDRIRGNLLVVSSDKENAE